MRAVKDYRQKWRESVIYVKNGTLKRIPFFFLPSADGFSKIKGLLKFRFPVDIPDVPVSSGQDMAKVFPAQMLKKKTIVLIIEFNTY